MPSRARSSRRRNSSTTWLASLDPRTRNKAGGALLLLAGAVGTLSLLFPDGPATSAIGSLLLYAGGWGAMSLPIGTLWAGGALMRRGFDGEFSIGRLRVAGGVLLWLSFLGLLHLLPIGESEPLVRAANRQGGGYLGLTLVGLLQPILGGRATVLLMLVGMVGGSALLSRVPPTVAALKTLDVSRDGWRRWRGWQAERHQRALLSLPAEPEAENVAVPVFEHPTVSVRRQSRPAAVQPPQAPPQPDSDEPPAPAAAAVGKWALPPIDVFEMVPPTELSQVDVKQRIRVIEETLQSFGVDARVVEVNQGPAITQFGVEPGIGVKVAKIMALANDLALRLAAAPLRLEAPVPGKQVVGIEVPNSSVAMVCIRDLLESQNFRKHRGRLRLALGRDVSGSPVVADLAKMPHLLIAGATGSGKSVCLNSFIAALLFQSTPDELRFLMIDPKMVEMMPFNGVPHLLTPVVTDMEKVVPSLKWVTKEMERRYRMFAARGVRNVESYNRTASGRGSDLPLPYIVVIIDELADLMMVAPDESEKIICRLAQLARATGIHLVVATQRPSVDVVTGLIKANFPTRISFAVTSMVDSRTILDQGGAEKLLGKGDMLYMPPDAAKPVRLQGTFVSDGEIRDLVDYWKSARRPGLAEEPADGVVFKPVEEEDEGDDLYDEALEVVSQFNRVSTSLLQRRLRIGYNRAARLMEILEREGVVGPSEGGKSREVLTRSEASEDGGEEPDPGEE